MTTPLFIPASTVAHQSTVAYISVEEYQNAPTSVDTSQLTPGGSAAENLMELGNVILRASGWANEICYQILAATLDTVMASDVYVRRDGTVHLTCPWWPFRELDVCKAGPSPSTLAAVTATPDIWLEGRKTLIVPVAGLINQSAVGNSTLALYGPVRPGTRCYVQWSYWNGWFHTTLAGGFTTPMSTLTLTSALPAAAAGVSLTIVDGASTEVVTVASTFTGGTALPLTAPTIYGHTITYPSPPNSITVTELPPSVRTATISLTSALIKTRGTAAIVAESIGAAPSREALIEGGGLGDFQVAVDLLSTYHRNA